jgi:hypothetical protein
MHFLAVPPEYQERFIQRAERAYFFWAHKYSSFPTDHQVFGEVTPIINKIARIEIFEDQQYYVKDHSRDEGRLTDFSDQHEDDFLADVMTVLNFQYLSYDSTFIGKYKNLPWGRVW